MKTLAHLFAILFSLALIAPSSAQTTPTATITVRNLSSGTIYNSVTGPEEISTYAAANPKPATSISSSGNNTFQVAPVLSGPFRFLTLSYKSVAPPATGGKECVFISGYTENPILGEKDESQWGEDATGRGGAICTATITATDPSTGNWSIELTMQ